MTPPQPTALTDTLTNNWQMWQTAREGTVPWTVLRLICSVRNRVKIERGILYVRACGCYYVRTRIWYYVRTRICYYVRTRICYYVRTRICYYVQVDVRCSELYLCEYISIPHLKFGWGWKGKSQRQCIQRTRWLPKRRNKPCPLIFPNVTLWYLLATSRHL